MKARPQREIIITLDRIEVLSIQKSYKDQQASLSK